MTSYPITFEAVHLKHQSGTKQYTIYLFKTDDGRSLHLNKYGKVGAFGQLQVLCYDTHAAGTKSFNSKERSRVSGGYRQEGPLRGHIIDNAKELRDAFGLPVWSKIGKEAINHLDPTIDTSGMREGDPPRLDEEGRLTGQDKPRVVDLAAEVEAEKARLAAESERTLKNNPNFGRFG